MTNTLPHSSETFGSAFRPHWVLRATGWAWRIVITLILGIVLLCQSWDYAYKVVLPWNNWLCLAIGAVGAAFLFLIALLIGGQIQNRKKRVLIMGLLSLVAAFCSFYSMAHLAFLPEWDISILWENAQSIADGYPEALDHDYFSRYPNNLLPVWLISRGFLLADQLGIAYDQRYFLLLAFQAFGFGLSVFLLYLYTDRLIGNQHPFLPLWSWFMGLILIMASPWIAVIYTDAMAVGMLALELLLYLKTRGGRHRPLWAGLLCFVGIITLRIKPQAFVFFIAAVLITLLTEWKALFNRVRIQKTIILLIACFLGAGFALGCTKLAEQNSGLRINRDISFSPAHYLLLGLNEEAMGGYAQTDVEFSASFDTYDERLQADLKEAGVRASQMGIGRVLQQAVRKLLSCFSDATFTWAGEDIFFAYETFYFPFFSQWMSDRVTSFYIDARFTDFVDQSHSEAFRLMEQCAWLVVLLLGLFSSSRKETPELATAQLGCLGVILFQVLFEVRGRQILCYAPLFISLATVGVDNMLIFLEKHAKLKKNDPLKVF